MTAPAFERLYSDIGADLDDLRRQGSMTRAVELTRATGQQFNHNTYPMYFTGDLAAPLVMVHLNPYQALSTKAGFDGELPALGLDDYLDQHRFFGKHNYGPASPRTHTSMTDQKQVRFIRAFGAMDLPDEPGREIKYANLEKAIDGKLQMEVVPYGSREFSRQGMRGHVLQPHWERLIDIITSVEREHVLFCGSVLDPLLKPFVTEMHRFNLQKNDGTTSTAQARFANMAITHNGQTIQAGFAPSYAQQGLNVENYARACARLY